MGRVAISEATQCIAIDRDGVLPLLRIAGAGCEDQPGCAEGLNAIGQLYVYLLSDS